MHCNMQLDLLDGPLVTACHLDGVHSVLVEYQVDVNVGSCICAVYLSCTAGVMCAGSGR